MHSVGARVAFGFAGVVIGLARVAFEVAAGVLGFVRRARGAAARA